MLYCLTFHLQNHILYYVVFMFHALHQFIVPLILCVILMFWLFLIFYQLMTNNYFMEADMDQNKELMINYLSIILVPDVLLTLLIVTTTIVKLHDTYIISFKINVI